MSYTNHTTHYELPQWVRDDKPTFLSDMNGAFDKIDRALHDNASAIQDEGLEVDRVEAKVDGYGDRLDTVEVKVGALETAQTGLDGRITHNSNDINTINSLIGNGEPTTQDKTIIGAINELAASGTPAEVNALKEKVGTGTLDTTSQNCVGAINEVNTKAGNAQNSANTANGKADAIANQIGAEPLTTTAQTLTGAINEINAKPSGGGDTVTITPALQSGTKVADYTINGVAGSLYAPTGGGGATTIFEQTYSQSTPLTTVGDAMYNALHNASNLENCKLCISKGSGINEVKEYYTLEDNSGGIQFRFVKSYTGYTSLHIVEFFVSSDNTEDRWTEMSFSGVAGESVTVNERAKYTRMGQDSSGNLTDVTIKIVA